MTHKELLSQHLISIVADARRIARSDAVSQAVFLNEFVNELRRIHKTDELVQHHAIAVSNDLQAPASATLSDIAFGADGAV